MPRQVDHDQRRNEVAEAACELIAAEGIDAVTVRRVAESIGCSTTIVSHYFSNKQEMLMFCYRSSAKNSQIRLAMVVKKDPSDLYGCLEALLPLDHARRRDWCTWFALYGAALGNSEFGLEHRSFFRFAVDAIVDVVKSKWSKGGVRDWHRTEAKRLFALVSGIAAQAVFDPEAFTPKKIRQVLETEISRIDDSRMKLDS